MDIKKPEIPKHLLPENSRDFIFGENQPEYIPLPSVRTPLGQVITRWSPTIDERLAIARGEDIFLTILSTGSINPIMVSVGLQDWNNGPRI